MEEIVTEDRRKFDGRSKPPHDHSGEFCPACHDKKRQMQADLQAWAERRSCSSDLVTSVIELHAMCQPTSVIARAAGLSETDVNHIVSTGQMPGVVVSRTCEQQTFVFQVHSAEGTCQEQIPQ